jgi:predicted O-methyltransferase YrrM
MNNWKRLYHYIRYRIEARTLHGLHSPFVFKLIETVLEDKNCTFDAFEKLNAIRKHLLSDETLLTIDDLGAGSQVLKSNQRQVQAIAKHGITKKNYSEFYFKLINYFNHQTIIELGTSLGLNTLYLAKSSNKPNVYSIEGSKALHEYAQQLIQKNNQENVSLLQGNFDEQFPLLLNTLKRIDFLLIDGNHTYEATMRYFLQALPYVNENTLIVFDDIYWSEGMLKAWEEIKQHAKVSVSLDFYYCGMVFFKTGFAESLHFKIKQP